MSSDTTSRIISSLDGQESGRNEVFVNPKKDRILIVFIYSLAACLGPFIFGYTIVYSASAAESLVLNETLMTSSEKPIFDSMTPVGAAFGGLLGGYLCERVGRRMSMVASQIPSVLGWILISLASLAGFPLLALGRIFNGLGIGLASLVVPVYLAELASTRLRGTLGTMNQLFITVGITFSYVLGKALEKSTKDWMVLSIIGVGITVVFLLLALFLLPESPTWLSRRSRQQEARQILTTLRGRDYSVEEELRSYEDRPDDKATIGLRELTCRKIFKPISIGVVLMIFQQFSGINAVLLNSTNIFGNAGFKDPRMCSVLVGIAMVISTLIGVYLMDRAGRRLLLVVGGVCMALSLCLLGICFYITGEPSSSSTNTVQTPPSLVWLSLVCLLVYIILFSVGWGPIPWLIMSEIFNARVRGVGSTITTFTNWALASIVTLTFDYMKLRMTMYGTFWFYSAICAASVLYVILQVPETKGKTIQQIEEMF